MIGKRISGVFARAALLAWVTFAVLAAAATHRPEHPETAPAVSAASRDILAIIRQDTAGQFFFDGRSRLEWSRGFDRSKLESAGGNPAIVRAAGEILVVRDVRSFVPDLAEGVDPFPVHHFDAQGPPLSA